LRVLWLLVARAGSKGIKNKNLRVLGTQTLIERKIRGASPAMRAGDRLVCSTEDAEIAAEAERHGAAWLKRPAELATDEAKTADVVWHAMKTLRDGGERYEAVMLLEPSAPFTRPDQYARALEIFATNSVETTDAVIGMKETTSAVFTSPHLGNLAPLAQRIATMQRARRQDVSPSYTPSGSLYLFRWSMFEKTRSVYGSDATYGLFVDRWSGLELDEPEDLALAEFLVERGLV